MELDKAKEICGLMASIHFHTLAIKDAEESDLEHLREFSLQEMIDAKNRVEEENKAQLKNKRANIHVVPDDRLIASIHTYLHYPLSNMPIIHFGGTALGVVPLREPSNA